MTVTSDDAHTVKSFQKILIPPERLFAAWVEPGLMRTWLFTGKGSRVLRVENDLRVGGTFSIVTVDDAGTESEHSGEYMAVDRPRGLMFSLEAPKLFPGVSVVSIDIVAGGEGSWFSFAQSGVKKELMETAWRLMFRRLNDELA